MHRFELVPIANGEHITQVNYNSRHTCDELNEKIRKEGDMSALSFGQQRDPCESFFKKVMSSFHTVTARDERGISGVNIGVTVKANMPMPAKLTKGVASQQDPKTSQASKIGNVWLKSDNAALQEIDPTTLEPVTVAMHSKLHPELKGPFTGAHSRTDPVTGNWYNYNLEIGRQAVYRVFGVSATTGKPTILATISGGEIKAAYLHSIMLTERYVVICIFSAYYAKNGLKILWAKNMLEATEFNSRKKIPGL
jgi:torulene dioxygenase